MADALQCTRFKIYMMNKFLSFLLLSFLATPLLQAQKQNSLLWEVKAPNGATSYLFGTNHLVGSDYLKTHEKVDKAFQNSKTVVVEMLVDSTKIMEMTMMGMMPGNSMRNLLDSADYALLTERVQEELGMDMTMLDIMKPVMISTFLSLAMAEESTPDELNYAGAPLDLFFANNGKKQGKEIVPLETMMEQAEILYNSTTIEEQANELMDLLKDEKKADKISTEILEAYVEENLDRMWKLMEEYGSDFAGMDALLDDRNMKWIGKLKPVLDNGNAFIAVGALHLPGKIGLIELLKTEGYKLKPVY